MGTSQSVKDFDYYTNSFEKRYAANINHVVPIINNINKKHEQVTTNTIEDKGWLIYSITLCFLTTNFTDVFYFPLLCTTALLHRTFTAYRTGYDKIIKNNIPEEDLRIMTQERFASKARNNSSSSIYHSF